jgi:hypothetical protein
MKSLRVAGQDLYGFSRDLRPFIAQALFASPVEGDQKTVYIGSENNIGGVLQNGPEKTARLVDFKFGFSEVTVFSESGTTGGL